MDQATAERLEQKLDQVIDALPIIEALGMVLIQRKTANDRVGLNKNTIAQNPNIEKFDEIGHRRTFIQVSDLKVIKQRKRTGKR